MPVQIVQDGLPDGPGLPDGVAGILVGRLGPVPGIPADRRPLAQHQQIGVRGYDVPASRSQVADLIKVVPERESDLKKDKDRLERLLGGLLSMERPM